MRLNSLTNRKNCRRYSGVASPSVITSSAWSRMITNVKGSFAEISCSDFISMPGWRHAVTYSEGSLKPRRAADRSSDFTLATPSIGTEAWANRKTCSAMRPRGSGPHRMNNGEPSASRRKK